MMVENKTIILVFAVVYLAMVASAFWEAYVEGDNPWDRRKLGWKIRLGKKYCLPAYHFFLFLVMWPALLALPLVIFGWNIRLSGILLSAYLTGIVIEDFLWFVVNPQVGLVKFNPEYANYYPWLKLGRFRIPSGYPILIILAFLSWFLFWK